MNTNRCVECGQLFWCDDEETDICLTCIEEPVSQANRARAIEQELDYIRSLRKAAKP